jgi:hypothetical protein
MVFRGKLVTVKLSEWTLDRSQKSKEWRVQATVLSYDCTGDTTHEVV